MSTASLLATEARGGAQSPRVRGRDRAGYGFVGLYALLLLFFGVAPTVYAIVLAFTNNSYGFVGLRNFINVARDFRFVPALEHIALYLVVWLVALVVLVVVLALMLHRRASRSSKVLRFLYYLPGALAGAASVVLWLFVLDPTVSPIAPVLRVLGYSSFSQTIEPSHLPFVFAVIAFWTGAGGWILVLFGALNTIPRELLEAAAIDGAGPLRQARYIQLPLMKKWIAYMVILAFAAGTQLFVEPQLVSEASLGAVSPSWSPNQLAYTFAFTQNNFNYAAAVAVDLLVIGLLCALVVVFRSGLFSVE